MTAQPGRPQAPFTSGELAPTLRERRDLKYYRSGASFMQNVEVLPQGGFRYCGGSVLVGRARRDLRGLSLGAAVITASNGGTAAYAVDNDPSVFTSHSVGPGAGPYSILEIALPAPATVSVVNVQGFLCSAGSGTISVQWNNGTNFVDVAPPKVLTTTARSRRFAFTPGRVVQAAQWRIVAAGLSDAATVTLGFVEFQVETANFGPTRLRAFMDKDGNETLHALSAGHVDVYGAGWLDSYGTDFPGATVLGIKGYQQLDTMVLFHQEVPPQRVLRQGSDHEWQSTAAPLVNLPNYDYGGAYVNGRAAEWQISIIGAPSDGTAHNIAFSITVNGEESPAIEIPIAGGGPDWAAFAAVVQDAVLALPGVSPGVTASYNGSGGGANFIGITFSGAGNEGDGWLVSMKANDKSDVACPAYRTARGIPPGEPIISDARGWPRCGIFYQQSMLLGGLKGLPNAWMKSESGNYWNFDTDTSSPAGAMLVPMDSQGGEAIEEMVAGRSVMIMTSMAEYFLADRAISKTSAPNHVQASRHGTLAGVPSVENEGAAIFVHSSGGVLYEFRYDEVAQTFTTKNLSILGSHLLSGVNDLAVRRATATNDANMLYAAQAGSGLRAFALLREQEVTAGCRRETNGQNPSDVFQSVAAMQGSNTIAVITEREVAHTAQRFVEKLDPTGLLDQATTFTFDQPTDIIQPLDDYVGAVVWAIADGDVIGPWTVPDVAALQISQKATVVTIGRWTPPRVETLPLDRAIGPGVVLERRARIHTLRISLVDTTSLAVGANGGRTYDVPLFRFGDQMDVPALQKKFTGVVKVQGLTGFADQPTAVITQKRPGYLNVRGITIEADL